MVPCQTKQEPSPLSAPGRKRKNQPKRFLINCRSSTGASRRPATRPAGPRSSRARQQSPPSTSTPAGWPLAALVTRRARRSTTASTAAIAVEAAADADGCGALVAAERAGEGTEPAPGPVRVGQTARGPPSRCVVTLVMRWSCASHVLWEILQPTFYIVYISRCTVKQ